jgi:hypothetical protein
MPPESKEMAATAQGKAGDGNVWHRLLQQSLRCWISFSVVDGPKEKAPDEPGLFERQRSWPQP